MTLLLASQSSGRAAMLRAAGLTFETSAAHVDEEALTASLLEAGQTPVSYTHLTLPTILLV